MSSVKASARTTFRTAMGSFNSIFNAVGQVASVVEKSANSLNKVVEGAEGSAVNYRNATLDKAAFNSIKSRNKLMIKLAKKEITQEEFDKALESIKENLS